MTRWTFVSYAYALVVAAVLAYFLLGLTVQLSDSFGNLLEVQHASLHDVIWNQGIQHGYVRPLLWAEIKSVYDLSNGRYYLWFRGIQVLQATAVILLVVALARPRTAGDASLVPFALAVLVGSHTFAPALREAFPINAFLTVLVGCAAVALIALNERSRWWTDVLSCVLLPVLALTVESGVLVWVVAAAAWALGARGVSRWALGVMTLFIAAYLVYRFAGVSAGSPGLAERASGFGFGILEPSQLVSRFGAHPARFYAYNIAASFLTVLFSEPKGGVWRFVYEVTAGRLDPWTIASVASSTATTALASWYVWMRRSALRAWALDRDDRIVLLFGAVLAANAIISYSYTKNIIMSPAGMLLAPVAFVAARKLVSTAGASALVSTGLLLVLSVGWAYRVVGTHYNLRYTAEQQRNEWAHVDSWIATQQMHLEGLDAVALRDALQRDAIYAHPTPPQPSARLAQWFDIDW